MSAEAYAALASLVDDNAQKLDEDVRPRVRAGAAISSRDYLLALAERERMKASFDSAIAGIDALLTPTALTPALPVATLDQNTTPAMFTRWVNFLDLCAAAVPNGFSADGLPTSLQIVCRGYAEPLALRIGYAYQAAHDWHLRVPPMAA
jgi:aspartyl-tRNA(Asn)/glutamyl-tRNA(Gln) amidotransferase subunit A